MTSQIYFDEGVYEHDEEVACRKAVAKRPTQPNMRDEIWSLIQHCCAEDTESRPTMDEIIEEMESWSFF
jgi:hypothetical protein